MFTRSVGSLSLYAKPLTSLDLGTVVVWRITRITKKECVQVFLCKPRANFNEEGLYLHWRCACACACVVLCCVVLRVGMN